MKPQEAPLNGKNAESFREALEAQYRDLIHEAILECETDHKTRLNIGKLNSKLKLITKAACYDGLSDDKVNQMIDEAVATTTAQAA
jgi:hypothetical protein